MRAGMLAVVPALLVLLQPVAAARRGLRSSPSASSSSSTSGKPASLLSLQRSAAANAAAPPAVEMTPAVQESLETFFQLQYVGMQERELAIPRSPLSTSANLCATVGQPDDAGGVALAFTPCESKQLSAKALGNVPPKTDKATAEDRRQRQLFSFLIDGKIREKSTGFCIRRVRCQDDNRYVYDLGDCMDAQAASWAVDRGQGNSANYLKRMGDPVTAVTQDVCPVFCGPYRLTEHCKGMPVAAGGGCATNFHAAPGWTRLPSQYVAPSKDPGAMMGGLTEMFNDLAEATGSELEDVKSGVAPLNQATGGICNSFVGDGPEGESWFYFLRTSEKGQVYAK